MKSLFRVKYYAYLAGAFSLVLYANSAYRPARPEVQLLLVTLPMMILGFLAITLKCECCGRGLFNLSAEKPRERFKKLVSLNTYLIPGRCPECGCERH